MPRVAYYPRTRWITQIWLYVGAESRKKFKNPALFWLQVREENRKIYKECCYILATCAYIPVAAATSDCRLSSFLRSFFRCSHCRALHKRLCVTAATRLVSRSFNDSTHEFLQLVGTMSWGVKLSSPLLQIVTSVYVHGLEDFTSFVLLILYSSRHKEFWYKNSLCAWMWEASSSYPC